MHVRICESASRAHPSVRVRLIVHHLDVSLVSLLTYHHRACSSEELPTLVNARLCFKASPPGNDSKRPNAYETFRNCIYHMAYNLWYRVYGIKCMAVDLDYHRGVGEAILARD